MNWCRYQYCSEEEEYIDSQGNYNSHCVEYSF